MFSARRWLQIILDALKGADEVLPDDEFDALLRAIEQHIKGLRK
jgi:hypothetical protein